MTTESKNEAELLSCPPACVTNFEFSRICELGTKSCIVLHNHPTQPSKDLDEVIERFADKLYRNQCSLEMNHECIKQACLSYSELANAKLRNDIEGLTQQSKMDTIRFKEMQDCIVKHEVDFEELTKIAGEMAEDLKFCIKHGKFISSTGLNAFQTFTAK